MQRTWLRRALILLGWALIVLEALYLVAANYSLNSSWAQKLANRRPEKYSVRWGFAWSVWPRAVHLRDVEVRGRTARSEWYARVDRVAAAYRILPFFDRTVSLSSVSAAGVDYRQRRKPDPGSVPEEPDSGLPDLPEFEAPASEPRPAPPPGTRPPWTILIGDVDADVDQVWFGRFRLTGEMNARTSMKLIVKGELDLPDVRFTMTGGSLAQGDRDILAGLRVQAETSIAPFVPKGVKALDILRLLKGRFQVQSESASLFFLEPYMERIPWLHFEGRSAALRGDFLLESGRMQAGSTLETDMPAVNVRFLDRTLLGRATLRAKVVPADEGMRRADIEFNLDEFSLASSAEEEPYARGRGFKVTIAGTALDPGEPIGALQVVADLPEALVEDLSWYNRYLPPGAGMAIKSGTGKLSYHFEGSQEEGSLHGRISFGLDKLVMQVGNYETNGNLRLEVPLKEAEVREGHFDVSGTTIDLESLKFPWKARIGLTKAEVTFSQPLNADAALAMVMTDTTPLVAVFDAQKEISGFVEKLMTICDISSTASVRVDEGGVKIREMEISGEDLEVLADLDFQKGSKDGILYIKFHGFSVGVELKNGEKGLDLVRARKWYEQRRSQRRGSP